MYGLTSTQIRLIWYVLIAATVAISAYVEGLYKPHLKISALSSKSEAIQVFCDSGAGFHESTSKTVTLRTTWTQGATLTIPLPEPCQRIRIDLGSSDAQIALLSASLTTPNGLEKDILKNINQGFLHDLRLELLSTGEYSVFSSSGNDPYVILDGDFQNLTYVNGLIVFFKLISLFVLIAGFFYFADYLARTNPTLLTILLVAILIRILHFIGTPLPLDAHHLHSYWPDEGTYYQYASRLLSEGIPRYFNSTFSIEVAPGNVLYTATLLSLFGGEIIIIRFFNLVFLSTATILFTYKAANLLFNYKVATIAAIVLAIYPEIVIFSPTLLTEPLFVTLVIAFIYAFSKLTIDPGEKEILILLFAACVAIFAAITRLVFLPIVLLLFVYAIYVVKKPSGRRNASLAGLLSVLILIGLTPFFLNGHKHSGQYMIATGSGAVLWLGSRSDTEGDEPPYRGKRYQTEEIIGSLSHLSLEGDRKLREAGTQNIERDPFRYALITTKKIGRLLIGNNYFWFFPQKRFKDWSEGRPLHERFIKLFSILFAIGVTLGAILYPLTRKSPNPSADFAYVSMLALVAAYLPFLVNQRYGLPIFAINSMFAAYSIMQAKKEGKNYLLLTLICVGLLIWALILAGV
jgi:hypothetical protein